MLTGERSYADAGRGRPGPTEEGARNPGQEPNHKRQEASRPGWLRHSLPLRAGDIAAYVGCDTLTEGLIYLMVVFSPWAFGSSQPWAVWVMNVGAYALGAMLALKLAIRWGKGYRPARWGAGDIGRRKMEDEGRATDYGTRWPMVLAVLTVAILAYCLVSALNASATCDPATGTFKYHPHLIWLPHSFDSSRTWFAFWSYLGLACSFWSIRDWLLGKSAAEAHPRRDTTGRGGEAERALPPARLRRLFWVLAINGGLLGVEAIVQRLEGSGKLLFLVKPAIHKTAATQFGPYAYYANASQYFNLLWPACLGFWWMLDRSRRHLVLACAAIMAACPIISTSRGGALISVGMLCLAAGFLAIAPFWFASPPQENSRARKMTAGALAVFFVLALALGFSLGWRALRPRMAQLREGYQNREQDYELARPIAEDYPVFGIGPGAFESVSQLYRPTTDVNWFEQLHNDWLETRITFGLVGSTLIALALGTVVLRWFAPGGIQGGRRFVGLMWLGLGGCLLHARFDFPFQVHSIVFLFLVLCAVLFTLSRRPCRETLKF